MIKDGKNSMTLPDPSKTSAKDIAAFTEAEPEEAPRPTQEQRDDDAFPKPLVKIVDLGSGTVVQATLAELNEQSSVFHKVILVVEDEPDDSDRCASALHKLGYDGVRLISRLVAAEQHLDDIIAGLTPAPDAIVLDLGLGHESGFTLLRKCHAEPKLQQIPVLVWTKHTDALSKMFSEFLGAQNFVVKSPDPSELEQALKSLLHPPSEISVGV